MKKNLKILFVASTFPKDDNDPVPPFVRQEAIWTKKILKNINISVLAPHNAYSCTSSYAKNEYYEEFRFHYFWPFKFELLAGRGIMPALKNNKLLYFQIPFFVFFETLALYRLTRKIKPDLIYAHWFMPQAIASYIVSIATKTKFVFDTQSSDVIVLKRVPYSKSIVKKICNRAVAYTAPSEQTANKLLYFEDNKGTFKIKDKLYKIPLGTSPYYIGNEAIKLILDKFGVENDSYIYFIGRLVERKGVDNLIEAYNKIVKILPKYKLVIVGDGVLIDKLKEKVLSLNLQKDVIFTGFLPEKSRFALLSGASIGVIPSINVGDEGEGLPIVFMEGVTMGKTMVISNVTGAHEYVTDGVDGFIYNADSVNELCDKISEALRTRNSPKHNKAIIKLAQKFQWETIVKKRFSIFFAE